LSANALSSLESDFDVFFVLQSDGSPDQVLFHSDDTGTNDVIIGLENSNGSFADQTGWHNGGGSISTLNNTSIIHLNLESGTSNADVLIDGVFQFSETYTPTSLGGTRTLGATSTGTNGFVGNIGEVIAYNVLLNDAQRIIVLNHLSAKYGIDISGTGYDNYSHDDVGYDHELIGIGREDANNLHTEASNGLFVISNPNDLNDDEYLMLAHENSDITAWATSDIPNASTYRVGREWRVDHTGNVGTVTIEIDTLQLPDPAEPNLTWVLMVDNDGDFSTVDDIYILSPTTGDYVGVNGVDLSTNEYIAVAQMKFETIASPADFNLGSTWSTGYVPYYGVTATITAGHQIYMTSGTIIGEMIIETGATLDLNGQYLNFSNGCIALEGTASVDVSVSGSSIGYLNTNAGSQQCITGMTYNHLNLSGGDAASVKYLAGDIIVDGNLSITSTGGVFDLQNFGTSDIYNITLRGNWQSDQTIFEARTGDVILDGTSTQTIDAENVTFYDLTINKTSGLVELVNNSISIENELDLTLGNIDIGTQNINVTAGASIVNGGANSYVVVDDVGILRHAVTSTGVGITFPIGDTDEYSPFIFTLNSGTLGGSNVTINLRDTKHTQIVENNYITRYWTLINENIGAPYSYNVSYFYDNTDIVGEEGYILARKFSPMGNVIGGTYNRSTNRLNYTGHTTFSDHTGESQNNGLPVELVSFTAQIVDYGVRLIWVTATELENDYFELERSRDGIHYEVIATVNGQGTINTATTYTHIDSNPIFGISYYRLVQVDFDGGFRIYDPVFVNNSTYSGSLEISFFPNPTEQENINVRVSNVLENVPVNILMYNLSGHKVHAAEIVPGVGVSDFHIRPYSHLPSGIYHVIIIQGDVRQTKKIIIN